MPYGKTVRIFLPDATVAGIRHAEIVNRTSHTLACPRSRLEELKNWPEQHPVAYRMAVGGRRPGAGGAGLALL
jgi:hypothetical protein